MRKTITVDLFSEESWASAMDYADEIMEELNVRADELSEYLAKEGATVAREAFGSPEEFMEGGVTVEVVPRKNGNFWVQAKGSQVYFMEFGTGLYADDSHEYANKVKVPVYSGSYSDTVGKHTYSQWVKSGIPLEEYPYNCEPRRAMVEAYKAMVSDIPDAARRKLGGRVT